MTPFEMSDFVERRQAQIAAQNAQAASRPDIAVGGGGPHDPDMEARVTALEVQAKETAQSLHRIEVTLAELKPVLAALPTKADAATASGALNTLAEKVSGLDARVGRVEANVAMALNTAIGKAIGPGAFVAILAGAVTILAGGATAYAWLSHQPWFPH